MNIRELFINFKLRLDNSNFKKLEKRINYLKLELISLSKIQDQALQKRKVDVGTDKKQKSSKENKEFEFKEAEKNLTLLNQKAKIQNDISKQNTREIQNKKQLLKLEEKLASQQKSNWLTLKRFLLGYGYIRASFSVVKNIRSTLEEIQKFRKTKIVQNTAFSKSDIKDAITFSGNMNRLLKSFRDLRNILTLKLLKPFSALIASFNNFFQANQKLIKSELLQYLDFLITIGEGLLLLFKKLKQALEPLIIQFGGWSKVIKGLLLLLFATWTKTVIQLLIKFSFVLLRAVGVTSAFRIALIPTIFVLQKFKKLFLGVFGFATFSPIGRTIGILGLLVVAFQELIVESDTFKKLWKDFENDDTFEKMWDAITSKVSDLVGWLGKLKDELFGLSKNNNIDINKTENLEKIKLKEYQSNFKPFNQPSISPSQKSSSKNQNVTSYNPINNININLSGNANNFQNEKYLNDIKNEIKKVLEFENQKFLAAVGTQIF